MRGAAVVGTIGALAAVGLLAATIVTLPPPPRRLAVARVSPSTALAGAYHVHSDRSDGTGTVDAIARAAAAARLQFVILTDHGDGVRAPDAPQYRHGVLLIDALEVSTAGGHYVALDMPAAPYRLAGASEDVAEDVARLGGFGIAAHPASLKSQLRWQTWNAPIDGLEWLNADSEWRDEPGRAILWALWHYPFRPAGAIASVLDRPTAVFEAWDRLTARRRVVGLAAVDAHASLGWPGDRAAHESAGSKLLAVPSYEAAFRTFSIRVRLASAPNGDAQHDARLLLSAIREGHLYSVIDAVAPSGQFDFSAESGDHRADMGDQLVADGPIRLRVNTDLPTGGRIVLFQNGRIVKTSEQGRLSHEARSPATFRVEARVPGAPGVPPVPWIVSNPIYAVPSTETLAPAAGAEARAQSPNRRLRLGAATSEHDPSSSVEIARETLEGTERLTMRYQLGSGVRRNQYAALVIPVRRIASFNRLSFTARADRPQRLSVQVRGETGERWQHSVYLDTTAGAITVDYDQLVHTVDPTRTGRPPMDQIRALLFVLDTVNTVPGASGTVTIEDLRYVR